MKYTQIIFKDINLVSTTILMIFLNGSILFLQISIQDANHSRQPFLRQRVMLTIYDLNEHFK